jgi:hypothetical protein
MLDPISLALINNFFQACHDLLADPASGAAESRPLLIAAGEPLNDDARLTLCQSAIGANTAILHLGFGHRVQAGPQQLEVIVPSAGACYVYTDCVLCPGEGNGLSLRRRSSRSNRFAIRRGELVQMVDPAPKLTAPNLERSLRRFRCHAGYMELRLEQPALVAQL